MTDLTTLAGIYAKQDWWQKRYDNAHERMAQAERTMYNSGKHLGILPMVNQIRDLLAPHFPNQVLNVLGPFGLGSTTSIHAYPLGLDDVRGNIGSYALGSLTFRPRSVLSDLRLALVDYGQDTGQFPKDSLGERNGLNYVEVPMPELPVLLDMLWKQIKDKAA